MARTELYESLKTLFENDWPEENPPIYFPDEIMQAPVGGDAFIEVQFPFSRPRTISIGSPGSNVIREEGGVRFVLNSASGHGIVDMLEWTEALGARLTNKTLAAGKVQLFELSSPSTDNESDRSGYFQSSVVIEYQHDYYG